MKYIIFASRNGSLPFNKVMAYMQCLTHQGFLGEPEYGLRDNGHVSWFSETSPTRKEQINSQINGIEIPHMSTAVRAIVIKEPDRELLDRCSQEYGADYAFYDSQ
jgi:hypothetical protein